MSRRGAPARPGLHAYHPAGRDKPSPGRAQMADPPGMRYVDGNPTAAGCICAAALMKRMRTDG